MSTKARGTTGRLTLAALGLLAGASSVAAATPRPPALASTGRSSTTKPPARAEAARPDPRRPDAALFEEAKKAEATLSTSAARQKQKTEWERVVLAYRKVAARYPRSGYSDNALLAVGRLYREMAKQFKTPRYRDDAIESFRRVVAEYPSSSLGEEALYAVVQMMREDGDRRRVTEAVNAYLDASPDGPHAGEVKALLRQRAPAAPVPSPPPPGLARIFDLRSWTGDSSTRVVIDLERKVPITSDRIKDPDRLWVDLAGARLHPNLKARSFPVADGLLEQIRIAQNRDDVVRIVLDFKDVKEHNVFYLEDPTRLIIDVRGVSQPGAVVAQTTPIDLPPAAASAPPPSAPRPAPPAPGPTPAATSPAVSASKPVSDGASRGDVSVDPLPTRRVNGMVPAEGRIGALPPQPAPVPIALGPFEPGPADRAPRDPAPTPRRRTSPAAPEPPDVNRAGSYSLARQLGLGARRIVIDAGHGGHDPGTIGRAGLQEKDLVLDVAQRLDKLVRAELGTEVVMTRSTDVFVPLEERTAIANSKGADLFLSIHANASRNPKASGIETYFLNFAQDPHAEAVAARENAISPATLKDLQGLVKAITLNSKIDESRDFATSVQEAMVEQQRPHHDVEDRGVHTAPFYVLIGANMPSVLAEIAFVSNPEDEKRLKSPELRDVIAKSLLRGVRNYLEALNRTQSRQLTGSLPRSKMAAGESRR
jgi:N-acetylmuramoyl-L-alanine amidase